MTARRRRGLLLLCLALASGGLAASQVHDRERRTAERLGPEVEVLVATRELPAGTRVGREAVQARRVPARFVPPDALPSGSGVVGASTAAPIPEGAYLTASAFAGAGDGHPGSGLRRGEREVTVEVAAGSANGEPMPGSRVDVLVSTETGAVGGRTTMALAGAELLRVGESPRSADGSTDGGAGPTIVATLRVTLRQAIYLTAADNFAREIRLLPRPPGDHSRAGGTVAQGQL